MNEMADIHRIATAVDKPHDLRLQDLPPPTDQVHKLLNESIEKIAQGWIDQLKQLRDNTVALESQMMACVARTKDQINQLHTLGEQVAGEARRGREVCEKLSEGIAQIAGEPS